MRKEELQKIILEQQNARQKEVKIVERELMADLHDCMNNDLVVVISGLRRSGKSTVLNALRAKHASLQGRQADYYMDFDDDRLNQFTLADFQLLEEVFLEMFGDQTVYYFDEIQNVKGWEKFVRRLHTEGKKVFVTGSNANMLSRELGTHLTGRYVKYELYPFSFKEFLDFKGITIHKTKSNFDTLIKKDAVTLRKAFNAYFQDGGLPGYLTYGNSVEYIDTLYDSILYKDVIVRNKLTKDDAVRQLALVSASDIGKRVSFSNLSKVIGVNNPRTVKEYFEHMSDAYLLFVITKYDASLRKQIAGEKKVYFIDPALSQYIGFRFSADNGRHLENLVFLQLKRNAGLRDKVFFAQNKGECDFVVQSRNTITQAIQVCYELHKDNLDREVRGLLEVMEEFNLTEGLIITYDQSDFPSLPKELQVEIPKNKTIKVIPAWQWLLIDKS